MSYQGRVMDDHEAFLYLCRNGCGHCVYVYIAQNGKVLQFDGEKLADCLIQRDGYLREAGLETQERLSINGRPDAEQNYMKIRQKIMEASEMLQEALDKLEREVAASKNDVEKAFGQELQAMLRFSGDERLAEKVLQQGETLTKLYKAMFSLAKKRQKGNVGGIGTQDIYDYYKIPMIQAMPQAPQREPEPKPQTSAGRRKVISLLDEL